jgi:hypothetical protein
MLEKLNQSGRNGQIRTPCHIMSQQEQFAAVVRRVEGLRARAGESARQGEGLFQSLLHEAFNGNS